MRTFGLLGLLTLLVTSLACSTLSTRSGRSGEMLRADAPGTVFFSIEDAAMDAMAYAHTRRSPAVGALIIVGTIQRVDGGFTYTAPATSVRHSRKWSPVVRYRLGANDVATYLIYARSDNRRTDRENERLSAEARRIVKEIDPEHRPLYQLTPSLNVLRYDGTTLRTVARLGEPRAQRIAARR